MLQWILSLVPLGAAIGISIWSYFNNNYGPRKTMLIQSPFTLFTWILLGIRDHLHMCMAARFLCGLFSVSYVISGERLLMESVHRYNIPRMIIGYRSCILGGVLFSYTVSGYLQKYNFRVIAINPIIILMHCILLWFCPESPVFLYNKNEQMAIQALIWYKGENNLSEELRLLKKEAEAKKIDPDADKYMFFSKAVIKALLIVLVLFFCQVFSGYYAMLFLYSKIYKKYGAHMVSDVIDPIIYGVVMLVANTTSSIMHFRGSFGTRKPLILSCVIIFISNVASLTYAVCIRLRIDYALAMFNYYPLISTCIYVIGYEVGLSACPDILLADYMPHQIYMRARMICKTFTWFLVFIFLHIYTFMRIHLGMPYVLTMMCLSSFLTLIFVCCSVVETQNKTLIAIQIELGGNPIGNRGSTRQRSLGVHRKLLTGSV